jgi:methyltransferase-like protein
VNYVCHDYLERDNHPLYFYEFVEAAAEHGLQYLSEAHIEHWRDGGLLPEAREALHEVAGEAIRREQYLDFLTNCSFRETLLCHDDVEIDGTLSSLRMENMSVTGSLECTIDQPEIWSDSTLEFHGPLETVLQTASPIAKAAFLTLGRITPQAVAFDHLLREACALLNQSLPKHQSRALTEQTRTDLAKELLQACLRGGVLLHVYQPRITSTLSERPQASPIARLQAASGGIITNQRHEAIDPNPLHRHLLVLMDGTRTRSDLLDDLMTEMTGDGVVVQKGGTVIRDSQQLREICSAELDVHLATALRAAVVVA